MSTRRQRLAHGAAFVAGLSMVFVALGYGMGLVGSVFFVYDAAVRYVAGAVLVIMGLLGAGVIRPAWSQRALRLRIARHPGGYVGSALVGLAFGVGWTPCVGPVLAGILVLAGGSGSGPRGAALLGVYALGFAIPFLGVAALLPTARIARRLGGWSARVAGGLLVALGLLVWSGRVAEIAPYLAALGSAESVLAGAAPGLAVALAAGALSFLSPCVLPLVPVYAAFLTGSCAPASTSGHPGTAPDPASTGTADGAGAAAPARP